MIEMSGDPNSLIPTTYIPTTSTGNVGYMVMSYPGRPPMVPGIPMPPGMGMPYMPLGGPTQMIPAVMPMAHPHMMAGPPMTAMGGHPLRPFRPHNPGQQQRQHQNRPRPAPTPQVFGPTVTVFVGNITDKAPDQMIRHILAACGTVVSWKRVQAFGFCEYGNPDAGLRAIRILHETDIGGKKLVAKVDAKTKNVLDEYKADKRKKIKGRSPLQDEPEEPDDYIDDDMKKIDQAARERIQSILEDYSQDMKNYSASNENDRRAQRTVTDRLTLLSQASDATVRDADGPIDLDDANIEEGKRDLITREIGKFREIMKKQEEEKEVERKRREEKERERRENESPISNGRSRSRARSQDSRGSRSSSRSETPDRRSHHKASRHRSRSRSRDRDRDRERERERERDRDRDKERDRDRDRDREARDRDDKKSERDLLREKEEEEESKERRKQERKAREKEAAYQERLRTWESRERHKAKELAKEKEKKRLKEEEREREAKRLKEFLEDYDDERDDIKYYKGRELQKRLEEREKEMELDARDRQKEKEELEELKAKIFSNPEGGDPNIEFAKALQEREELYRPKLVINVNAEHAKLREKEKEKEREKEREKEKEREREREREAAIREREREEAELEELRQRAVALAEAQQEAEMALRESEQPDMSPARSEGLPSPEPESYAETKSSSRSWSSPSNSEKDKKKKKLDVKEVFNNDDEDDTNTGAKKRKLVPLDYGDDRKKSKDDKKEDAVGKSQEEKRKHIKTLIDKIPTDKNALFAFQLDWAAVDNQLMERRIRPWINKKIIEYIGEPEPTLVDFICSKVLAGSAPQGILDDVQMVLDEEAEVFVVKMWRLLIYEIEAKKLGLVK